MNDSRAKDGRKHALSNDTTFIWIRQHGRKIHAYKGYILNYLFLDY
jgi:hypothetical protein